MIAVRARQVLARVQPAMPKLFLRVAEDDSGRPADSRRSRGVNRVELHGGHRRWHAAGVVQHEHLPADGAGEVPHRGAGAARDGARTSPAGRRSRASWRACPSSGACSRPRRSPRAGGCMPSRLGSELGRSTAIRRRGSGSWRASSSAPFGSSSIPACTRWAGRAIGRASTSRCTSPASRSPRSIATSHGRVRRWPTSWVS